MMAAISFSDAAMRHWKDAQTLSEKGRWANASQLFGLAAECALKQALIATNQVRTLPDGDIVQGQRARRHVNQELYDEYCQNQPTELRRAYPMPAQNPFQDWCIDQRYWSDGDVPTEHQMRAHENAAKLCLYQIAPNGVLP